ncbi:MAG: hypothetical protein HQ472_10510 [Ignavibacteria bacterium]|nr:hypothetical protein [Ignavibacteria bacterium]
MIKASIFILILLLGSTGLFAQRSGSAPIEPDAFRVQALYRAGVAQSYEIEENTEVVRTHSDSSKKTYKRWVKYFATIRAIESMNGIAVLTVTLDSNRYKFTADGLDVTYDSQVDITPKNFADLYNYSGPLSRSFEITVSPYGEVTKVAGDQLDFWRNYLNENKNDMDSVLYMIWIQSLERPNLLQYGDLQKRVIPGNRVSVDSTWDHDFTLRVDGVVYSNNVKSKFAKNAGGVYVLETKDTIVADPQRIHAYGIPYVSDLIDGDAIVDHSVELTNTGTINLVTSNVNAWFTAKVSNEIFNHKIKSKTTWKLTGQYIW